MVPMMILAGLLVQTGSASAKAVDPDKKVCRSQAETGSIMGRRVCHTRAEWAALSKAAAGDNEHFRDQSTNPGIPFNGGRGS